MSKPLLPCRPAARSDPCSMLARLLLPCGPTVAAPARCHLAAGQNTPKEGRSQGILFVYGRSQMGRELALHDTRGCRQAATICKIPTHALHDTRAPVRSSLVPSSRRRRCRRRWPQRPCQVACWQGGHRRRACQVAGACGAGPSRAPGPHGRAGLQGWCAEG